MNIDNQNALRDSNLAVLANVVELASQIVMNVAGNDIANTLGGQPVTPAYLHEAVAARVQANLTPFTGDR